MALAVLLRGAARPEAIRSALRLGSIQLKNPTLVKQTFNLSQFTKQGLNAIALQKSSNLVPRISNTQIRQAHMDHGLLWTIERVWALALLGIVPLTFMAPSTIMDDIFAISVIIHNHWGLEAVVIDYVRPVIFGDTIPKLSLIVLYMFSIAVLGGLLYFNHNDIGIGKGVRKLWNIRETSQ
ncbi:succinate dehydrogenase [Holotrichia oblita]|uniref:Succinate dehydrogenase n=1 Tax=Holotrichia oblita TaxID=644536 RepID=A0ACB9TI64_HOLOL|nr:succinate dehydrogenase [Holotrichia oblita]